MVFSGPLHYRIVEKLGDGGTSVMYKAAGSPSRWLALKFLPERVSQQALEFIPREMLANLAGNGSHSNHPNRNRGSRGGAWA
jgi:hypothetical protein